MADIDVRVVVRTWNQGKFKIGGLPSEYVYGMHLFGNTPEILSCFRGQDPEYGFLENVATLVSTGACLIVVFGGHTEAQDIERVEKRVLLGGPDLENSY